MYEKTTCQNYIKFISVDYLQLDIVLQLFTSSFTVNTNIFTSIKVVKTHLHIFMQTQKLFKMQSTLKLGLN